MLSIRKTPKETVDSQKKASAEGQLAGFTRTILVALGEEILSRVNRNKTKKTRKHDSYRSPCDESGMSNMSQSKTISNYSNFKLEV